MLLLLLLTAGAVTTVAQTFTLTGRVVDEENNPIELANVSCAQQGKLSMTNLKGEFSITLKSADSVVVKFSMVGYNAKRRVFRNPKGKMQIEVMLPSLEALGEVVVTERRRQNTPTEQLSPRDTRNAPSSSGNAVEELVQQQAGVSSHNELSSQYNVRGGSFDENSVYINSVEVYQSYRGLSTTTRTQRRAGGTQHHQPRHGGEHRLLQRRLRGPLRRQDVIGTRHPLPPA